LPTTSTRDALKVGGSADLLIIDSHHYVALLEANRLRRRAVRDLGDDDALGLRIEAKFIG